MRIVDELPSGPVSTVPLSAVRQTWASEAFVKCTHAPPMRRFTSNVEPLPSRAWWALIRSMSCASETSDAMPPTQSQRPSGIAYSPEVATGTCRDSFIVDKRERGSSRE